MGLGDVDPLTLAAWLCLAAAVALISKTLVTAVLTRRIFRFLVKRQAALSAELTARLLSRPLLEVQARASQDTAFVLTVATQSAVVGVLGSTSQAIADFSLLAVLGLGLLAIDPTVTLFSVVFFGALAYIMQRSLSGWATRIGREAVVIDIESYQAIQEALASYREVMVSDRRGVYVERIQDLRWRSAALSADTQFMVLIPKYVFEIALVVGGLALAVTQVASKDLVAAVGIVAVFLAAGSRVMPAIMRLQVAAISIRTSEVPASKAVVLAQELRSSPAPNHIHASPVEIRRRLAEGHPDFRPNLMLENVGLTYPDSHFEAVSGVTFSASEGAAVALVGSTGAGKSTLADLILGVVDPDVGTALIGGLAPSEAVAKWPGGISYVPQDVALNNSSVRENVTLGLPRDAIDDDRVWMALERAHLSEYLRESREGLDTLVGEKGMRLSGGQRQRLGVARALFTQPRLLVLDEATSALDAETEDAINRMMRELDGYVTTVTIAHRLATVRHCDLVIYLENGRVAAQGSFDEVRATAPRFNHQAKLLGL